MRRIWLEEKTADGKVFYFAKIGSELHERPSFILWVNPGLIKREENGLFIEFPLANAELTKGKKSLILRKGERNVFDVFVPCGYRGESWIEILTPADVFGYEIWKSPRGSLGVGRGALVCTSAPMVKFSWKRTGRLYGSSPEGISIVHLDGREEQLEFEEDALASLD